MSPPLPATSHEIYICFRVHARFAQPRDRVWLLGSLPELGEWNPSRAIETGQVEGEWKVWQATVRLPVDVTFQWAWCTLTVDGRIKHWEACDKRVRQVSCFSGVIHSEWGDNSIEIFQQKLASAHLSTVRKTKRKHTVAVIGSTPSLGSWDPKRAVVAQEFPLRSGQWSVTVFFDAGTLHEWNWVVIDKETKRVKLTEKYPTRFLQDAQGWIKIHVPWNSEAQVILEWAPPDFVGEAITYGTVELLKERRARLAEIRRWEESAEATRRGHPLGRLLLSGLSELPLGSSAVSIITSPSLGMPTRPLLIHERQSLSTSAQDKNSLLKSSRPSEPQTEIVGDSTKGPTKPASVTATSTVTQGAVVDSVSFLNKFQPFGWPTSSDSYGSPPGMSSRSMASTTPLYTHLASRGLPSEPEPQATSQSKPPSPPLWRQNQLDGPVTPSALSYTPPIRRQLRSSDGKNTPSSAGESPPLSRRATIEDNSTQAPEPTRPGSSPVLIDRKEQFSPDDRCRNTNANASPDADMAKVTTSTQPTPITTTTTTKSGHTTTCRIHGTRHRHHSVAKKTSAPSVSNQASKLSPPSSIANSVSCRSGKGLAVNLQVAVNKDPATKSDKSQSHLHEPSAKIVSPRRLDHLCCIHELQQNHLTQPTLLPAQPVQSFPSGVVTSQEPLKLSVPEASQQEHPPLQAQNTSVQTQNAASLETVDMSTQSADDAHQTAERGTPLVKKSRPVSPVDMSKLGFKCAPPTSGNGGESNPIREDSKRNLVSEPGKPGYGSLQDSGRRPCDILSPTLSPHISSTTASNIIRSVSSRENKDKLAHTRGMESYLSRAVYGRPDAGETKTPGREDFWPSASNASLASFCGGMTIISIDSDMEKAPRGQERFDTLKQITEQREQARYLDRLEGVRLREERNRSKFRNDMEFDASSIYQRSPSVSPPQSVRGRINRDRSSKEALESPDMNMPLDAMKKLTDASTPLPDGNMNFSHSASSTYLSASQKPVQGEAKRAVQVEVSVCGVRDRQSLISPSSVGSKSGSSSLKVGSSDGDAGRKCSSNTRSSPKKPVSSGAQSKGKH